MTRAWAEDKPGVSRAEALRRELARRLEPFSGRPLIMTYDGSVQDQVLLALLRTLERSAASSILCSTRPCMEAALKAEVEAFARSQELDLISIPGPCELEPRSFRIKLHRCGEISEHIEALLQSGAVHVMAGLSQPRHLPEMRATHGKLCPESYFLEDVYGGCGWASRKDAAVLHFLPFHGLLPEDLLILYECLIGQAPAAHQVPICLAPCYSELEKMKLLRLIRRSAGDDLGAHLSLSDMTRRRHEP